MNRRQEMALEIIGATPKPDANYAEKLLGLAQEERLPGRITIPMEEYIEKAKKAFRLQGEFKTAQEDASDAWKAVREICGRRDDIVDMIEDDEIDNEPWEGIEEEPAKKGADVVNVPAPAPKEFKTNGWRDLIGKRVEIELDSGIKVWGELKAGPTAKAKTYKIKNTTGKTQSFAEELVLRISEVTDEPGDETATGAKSNPRDPMPPPVSAVANVLANIGEEKAFDEALNSAGPEDIQQAIDRAKWTVQDPLNASLALATNLSKMVRRSFINGWTLPTNLLEFCEAAMAKNSLTDPRKQEDARIVEDLSTRMPTSLEFKRALKLSNTKHLDGAIVRIVDDIEQDKPELLPTREDAAVLRAIIARRAESNVKPLPKKLAALVDPILSEFPEDPEGDGKAIRDHVIEGLTQSVSEDADEGTKPPPFDHALKVANPAEIVEALEDYAAQPKDSLSRDDLENIVSCADRWEEMNEQSPAGPWKISTAAFALVKTARKLTDRPYPPKPQVKESKREPITRMVDEPETADAEAVTG